MVKRLIPNPKRQTLRGGRRRWLGMVLLPALLMASLGLPHDAIEAQTLAQRNAFEQLRTAYPAARSHDVPADGVVATSVPLYLPTGLAYDAAGNLYVAERQSHIIRRIDLAGILTTVAGTGDQGFGGDGGEATSALLDSPTAVAVDSAGSLYIADTHNQRIRKVTSGTITTVAGTGASGFSGDGAAASAALLNLPSALAIDAAGDVYLADTANHRIRKLSGASGSGLVTITTVAGDGEQLFSGDGGLATAAGLDSPYGIAVDAAGNLYIGDTHNQRVRLVTEATGLISTLAGTGVKTYTGDGAAPALTALARPRGIGVSDTSGAVFIADSDNNRIRMILGQTVTNVAGDGTQGFSGDTGPSAMALLDTPWALAVNTPDGAVAFSDSDNDRVRSVVNDDINTIAGLGITGTPSLVLSGDSPAIYGSGMLTATFSFGSQVATGTVQLIDVTTGAIDVGTATLAGNLAAFSLAGLSAGTHLLAVTYGGDANNAPITSGVFVLTASRAPLSVQANSASIAYGATPGSLTGTLTGVLPQDVGKVSAIFSTTATATSAPGVYPIAVMLSGTSAGDYTLMSSTSASVTVTKAATTVTLNSSNLAPAAGVSVTFTAAVVSTTTVVPTGTVTFLADGQSLASAIPLGGDGRATYTTAFGSGMQSISVAYSGDTDFTGSSSSPIVETLPSNDFTLGAGPATQSILPGASASYNISLTPQLATFDSGITLTASGLPGGATATFTPSSVAAGATSMTSTLTVVTVKQDLGSNREPGPWHPSPGSLIACLFVIPFVSRKVFLRYQRFRSLGRYGCTTKNLGRRSSLLLFSGLSLLLLAGTVTGCGADGFFGHAERSYTITITATGAAIGAIPEVVHTSTVTLIVQ